MTEDKINLLPEDLRQKEKNAADRAKSQALTPDLSMPERLASIAEDQSKLSGSRPSFFARIMNLFRRQKKTAETPESVEKVRPAVNQAQTDLSQEAKINVMPSVTPPPQSEPTLPPVVRPMPPKQTPPPIPRPVFTPPPAPKPTPPPIPRPVFTPPPAPKPTPPPQSEPTLPPAPIFKPEPVIKPEAPQQLTVDKELKPEQGKFHQPDKIIRARFIEDGSGVNLVPGSTKIKTWQQIMSLVILTLVSSLGIVTIFYFGLLTWNKTLDSNRFATEDKIDEIESQLLQFSAINKEINKKGQEITLVYNLLNKHIYWTNFFRLLEKYTTEDVYYTGFSAGNNGAMVLDSVAKDYAAVGRQLKILQQPEAKEFATAVDISSASGDAEGKNVSFSITLTLNPDLFYFQND